MLTAAGGEFIKTLLLLVRTDMPPGIRLGAARAGLELAIKMRDAL